MNTPALADRTIYLSLRTTPSLKHRHQLWYQTAAAMAVVFVACAGMAIVDERTMRIRCTRDDSQSKRVAR